MKNLHESITLQASPEEIYDVLMDSEKHGRLIEAETEIENKVGGGFSLWNGGIVGENVELEPGKKIVQKWRAEQDNWPKGHYSILKFELISTPDGTMLTLDQKDIPDDDFDNVKNGWKDYYFVPLKELFNK
jgi:activator of HSP90 ATPase